MISGISVSVFFSLEAGTAFDTNLGWKIGANRWLVDSRHDPWIDWFFYFQPSNDVVASPNG
jgi:hypothetical protein